VKNNCLDSYLPSEFLFYGPFPTSYSQANEFVYQFAISRLPRPLGWDAIMNQFLTVHNTDSSSVVFPSSSLQTHQQFSVNRARPHRNFDDDNSHYLFGPETPSYSPVSSYSSTFNFNSNADEIFESKICIDYILGYLPSDWGITYFFS
ncbi:hypothetical protein HZS_823, partial [Henneguya salminicola]